MKQISIYEKALEYNPQSTISLWNKLRAYECRNINNNKDNYLNVLWQNIIQNNPRNTILWRSYLSFILKTNKNNSQDEKMHPIQMSYSL